MNKEYKLCISKDDIEIYANISGDFNPIHRNINYAKDKGFNGIVIHGMLLLLKIEEILINEIEIKDKKVEIFFLKPVIIIDDYIELLIKEINISKYSLFDKKNDNFKYLDIYFK